MLNRADELLKKLWLNRILKIALILVIYSGGIIFLIRLRLGMKLAGKLSL